MKTLNESIIGRKGAGPLAGPFRSIIIVPMESDYLTFKNNLSYVIPFEFGADDIWTGFAAGWENAEDIFMNTIWPQTMVFVSNMPINDFIKKFTHTNKHSRTMIAFDPPKDYLINPPKGARQITLEELREIVKKYR